jgi:hypothetical protein
MQEIIPRSHQRVQHQAPIRFSLLNSEQFHPTRMYNFSNGGLCYETERPLAPKDDVCIVMENYNPDQSGPEGFRSYLARIRWIQLISKNGTERYAAGAQWVARSHDVMATDAQVPHHHCDLCTAIAPLHKLELITCGVQLCQPCARHFSNIPAGKIRQCVERFLLGNVI